MLRLFVVVSLFSLFSFADHGAKLFCVTEKQLGELEELNGKLGSKSTEILTNYNDPEVMPRSRDRRIFEEDMHEITHIWKGPGSMESWIAEAKKSTIQPPVTPPPQPPQPTSVKVEVKGYWVVGKEDSKDYSAATVSHQSECTQVESHLREALAPLFHTFVCGSVSNVSQYANIKYYQLASSPVVTIKIPSDWRTETIPGGSIAGSTDDKNAYGPYASWWASCKVWIAQQKSSYRDRFVAAACGAPQNVSQYANIGYKKYTSQGVVLLKDE